MSEIPYYFETPIPRYFRENGWFECEHMFKLVHWAFARCQNVAHTEIKFGREIHLAAYEFIAGRLSSPIECFLSENVFRNQLLKLEKAGLLKKTTNSLTNKYTCYVWVTDRFQGNNNQQNNQQATNRQPTDNHKERIKKDISNDISNKEEAQPAEQPRPKDPLLFNFQKMEFEGITEKDLADWKLIYPHLDLKIETLKAAQWLRNNPSKSKKSQWRKYLTGWFGRANETLENKKAYRSASQGVGQDRSPRDINGNILPNPYAGKF